MTDEIHRRKAISVWLFAVATMLVVMIVLGGVTRLTQSGLSMVDWRPVTGWLPPFAEAEWEAVFARYRAFPEYQKNNFGMTLAEFKSIFWLEFLHRLWGRVIGVAFFVPLVVFAFKGWIARPLAHKMIGLFVLGALQGVMGWYMVKSGLVLRPDVSQYRLAAHFGLALAILGFILWLAIGLLKPDAQDSGGSAFTRPVWALLALISLTAISGVFVAGLDGGLTYNTFPLMDGQWVPDGLLDVSPVYLNFFENITTVQFDHRVLAIATFLSVVIFWLKARGDVLTIRARKAVNVLLGVAIIQVTLGIFTLLLVVPVSLAALHQLGAVALFSTAIWLVRELKGP
ncbi:MAG: COX15/CtaA family protein [Rhodospirillales bacterium]